jgi:hypothetical protein
MKLKNKYVREYRIWKNMRARVNSPCNSDSTYQKKGIKCCRRWNSFEHFLSDMGPCPENHSLDRIDNNGNYEPSNCRWATQFTQSNNRGDFNISVHYKGETHTLKEWCRILKLKYSTIHARIHRKGMSFEAAIKYVDPRDELLLWNNRYYTKKELSEMYNIPLQAFYDRRRKGWPLEKILNTPFVSKIHKI